MLVVLTTVCSVMERVFAEAVFYFFTTAGSLYK